MVLIVMNFYCEEPEICGVFLQVFLYENLKDFCCV